MLDEGSETCDGFDYKYLLFSESWFGWYQVSVAESFLDVPGRQLFTKEFEVGGHAWRIRLDSGQHGKLGAFLCSQNKSILDVHLAFTLVNRADKRKSLSMGDLFKFHSNTSLGYSDLASITKIKDHASGYLQPDGFVVKLEMRLKNTENEECSFASDSEHIQAWMLKDLYGSSPSVMKTEEFEVDGHKWQLQIYPRGKDLDSKNVAFLVRSCNQSVTRAKFRLSVASQISKEKISKEFDHTFLRDSDEHGCNAFLETINLKDETLGFQKDGWITLTAQISVRDPEETYVRPPQGAFANPPPGFDPIQGRANSSESDPKTEFIRAEMMHLSRCVESMTLHQDSVKTVDSCAQDNGQTVPNGSSSEGLEDGAYPYGVFSPIAGLASLKPDTIFSGRYEITEKIIQSQPNIRFANDVLDDKLVVLKFYPTRQVCEKSFKLHKLLTDQHMCKMIDCFNEGSGSRLQCLVFEKGNDTLRKWMEMGSTDLSERKEAMFQVLQCLRHIHSLNIVLGDINPDNIAYFPLSRSWKFLSTDTAVHEGTHCRFGYTNEYVAPERIEAEDNGQPTIAAHKSMDMWAFGLVAYELLTEKRFHGSSPNIDTVKDYLRDASDSTYLEQVEDESTKEWLGHFLCFRPEKRWTAQKALEHSTFTQIGHTTETVDGFRQLEQGVLIKERIVHRDREYMMIVKNLNELKTDAQIESQIFESGGRRWKVGVAICGNESNDLDAIKILLLSCNNLRVGANVTLSVDFCEMSANHKETKWADSFGVIMRQSICIDPFKKAKDIPPDRQMVITVELKHIESDLDPEKIQNQGNTVNLEIFDKETIKEWLNAGQSFGIAPPHRKSTVEVPGSSKIRQWADRSRDRRYWLCERSDTGFVSVKNYLNKTDMFVEFDALSKHAGGGFPWVTIFKEEKNSCDCFQELISDPIIVFCKLFSETYKNLTYLGHLIVKKDIHCQQLLAKIVYEVARFSDSVNFDLYMERDEHRIIDITGCMTDLPTILTTNGLKDNNEAGYIVILRKRATRNKAEVDAVRSALQEIHEKAGETKQNGEGNIMTTSNSAPIKND